MRTGAVMVRGTEEQIEQFMELYHCDRERVLRYNALRDEGHAVYQALVLAGLKDPDY